MLNEDPTKSVVYSSHINETPITAFPRCGLRFIGNILCGRRLAISYGALRCRRHGDLDDFDVIPAILRRTT